MQGQVGYVFECTKQIAMMKVLEDKKTDQTFVAWPYIYVYLFALQVHNPDLERN